MVWNYGGVNTVEIVVLNAEFKQGCQNVEVVTPECASASGLDFLADVRYGLAGTEGCTPGYWKQSQHFDSWKVYSQSQTIGSVFTSAKLLSTQSSKTLLDALQGGGGSGIAGAQTTLLRAAVAALLNAASDDVDYTMSTEEIIAAVNAALDSNNRDTMLKLAGELDADNNLGCPLN